MYKLAYEGYSDDGHSETYQLLQQFVHKALLSEIQKYLNPDFINSIKP